MELSKKQEYLIIAGLLILIFPFFALLFYVHPQNDDYFFAYKVRELGVVDFVKMMYFHWSGRYSSMFIGAFNPTIFESIFLYRLSLALFQLFTISSIVFFVRSIVKPLVKNRSIIIFSLIFYTIFINSIPDVYEFLYWFPSVSAYQFGISLYLIFLGIYFFMRQKRISKLLFLLINTVLAFFIIGLNEIFIFPLLITSIIFLIHAYYNRSNVKQNAIILGVVIVSAIIIVSAPGNYVRIKSPVDSYNFIVRIYLSVKSSVYLFGFFIQNATFILSGFLFIVFANKYIIEKRILVVDIKSINPIWIIIFTSTSIALMFFPSLFSLGYMPAWRIYDFMGFFLLALILVNIIFILKYYESIISFHISQSFIRVISVLTIISMFSGAYFVVMPEFSHGYKYEKNRKSNYFQSNVLGAYYTLLFESTDFSKEMSLRYISFKKAQDENKNILQVKPMVHNTKMLLFSDANINSAPELWFFNCEANYYNMDSIIIQRADTIIYGRATNVIGIDFNKNSNL